MHSKEMREIYEAIASIGSDYYITTDTDRLARNWLINESGYFEKHPNSVLEGCYRGKKLIVKCASDDDAQKVWLEIAKDHKAALEYAYDNIELWCDEDMRVPPASQYEMRYIGKLSPTMVDCGNGIFVEKDDKRLL